MLDRAFGRQSSLSAQGAQSRVFEPYAPPLLAPPGTQRLAARTLHDVVPRVVAEQATEHGFARVPSSTESARPRPGAPMPRRPSSRRSPSPVTRPDHAPRVRELLPPAIRASPARSPYPAVTDTSSTIHHSVLLVAGSNPRRPPEVVARPGPFGSPATNPRHEALAIQVAVLRVHLVHVLHHALPTRFARIKEAPRAPRRPHRRLIASNRRRNRLAKPTLLPMRQARFGAGNDIVKCPRLQDAVLQPIAMNHRIAPVHLRFALNRRFARTPEARRIKRTATSDVDPSWPRNNNPTPPPTQGTRFTRALCSSEGDLSSSR